VKFPQCPFEDGINHGFPLVLLNQMGLLLEDEHAEFPQIVGAFNQKCRRIGLLFCFGQIETGYCGE
jgi:hypothetical protein